LFVLGPSPQIHIIGLFDGCIEPTGDFAVLQNFECVGFQAFVSVEFIVIGCPRIVAFLVATLMSFRKKMLAEGYSNGSVNRSMASLRRAFTLAAREGKIRTLPYFSMLPESKPRKDTLPHEFYPALLKVLPAHVQVPTAIGYATGMRLGEIKSLTWENINFFERFIRIEDSKSGDPRVIPFGDDLEKLLREQYARRQGCDRVCYSFDHLGHPRPLGNFSKVWRRVCIRLGLGKMTPVVDSDGNPVFEKPRYATSKPKQKLEYSGLLFHGLRRSFVTAAENANVPRHEAMKLSGHKTENTYRRYLVENLNQRRAAVAAIAAYRAKQVGDISGTAEASDAQQEPVIN
jgi:integrase